MPNALMFWVSLVNYILFLKPSLVIFFTKFYFSNTNENAMK